MRRWKIILSLLILIGSFTARGQEPLYWVNGERCSAEEFHRIDPELIEEIETLPADEESIALYGPEAGNGVIRVTLKNDTPARFLHPEYEEFAAYVTARAAWRDHDPTARVSIRFTISEEGIVTNPEVLEATDKRLLRRVVKALEESPRWEPARKMGEAVSSTRLLNLTLPEGREMPLERYIIIR